MGLILSRFRGKSKTTLEILDGVDTEIKDLEGFRRDTEQQQKRIIARFIIFSVFMYMIAVIVVYFYYFPDTFLDKLFSIGPLVIVPFIFFLIKRILTWYYNRKINKKITRLNDLKKEKQQLLEKVMETETYKVAKTILEKYSPDSGKRLIPPLLTTPSTALVTTKPDTSVRQRTLSFNPTTPMQPIRASTVSSTLPNTPLRSVVNPPRPSIQLPRSILPKDRSAFDKMVDYLIGDGPSYRNALICKNCFGHNGMALPEEYEYLSYYCCYCRVFNPARKTRPLAPKLEVENTPRVSSDSNLSDEEGSNSSGNHDSPAMDSDSSKPEKPFDDEPINKEIEIETIDAKPVEETSNIVETEL